MTTDETTRDKLRRQARESWHRALEGQAVLLGRAADGASGDTTAVADDPAVAAAAAALAETVLTSLTGYWHDDAAAAVRPLAPGARLALTRALLAARDDETASEDMDPYRVSRIDELVHTRLGTAVDGLPREALALFLADWETAAWVFTEPLATVVGHALDAGLPISRGVTALVRRQLTDRWGARRLGDLLPRLAFDEPVNPGEAWSDAALAGLRDHGPAWEELLRTAADASGARPTAAWEKRVRAALAGQPGDAVRERLVGLLALIGKPRTTPLRRTSFHDGIDPNLTFDPHNADVARGLIWATALLEPHPDISRTLGAVVGTALRKVPGLGPRSPKLAGAAVLALSRTDADHALGQLARLAATVTFKTTLKAVRAALDARAEALGLTRDEVEELAVPDYGLTEVGRRAEVLGDTTVELVVTGPAVGLRFTTAAGKVLKSPPAAVKRDHADALKELKAAAKDIGAMLSAQSDRLDRQVPARRTWRVADWRTRYLDHPLVGTLARRLIWTVDGDAVAFTDGALRTLDGTAIDPADDAEVALWHPIGREIADVLAWRGRLEEHGITQPFKQAHREVYLLTPAEETTRTYSNRFAAHVLRQHQVNALAAARGWHHRLRMMVDDAYPPAYRELPEWGLRAEYWVHGAGDDFDADTLDSGAYRLLTTDQVRFYPIDAAHSSAHACDTVYERWVTGPDATDPVLPLADVPPLVFSEVMRDIDLFVGVGSVGNDPNWSDGGPEQRHRQYWQDYAFGELSATAQTRRDILSTLLPRLAVGKVASIEGRFLRVQGSLRAYRIHLGSANILMEPGDRYLCIVPSSGKDATGEVFLPFEGDRTLAVVLSKAMLLAKDDAITDPSIVSQLRY